MRTDLADTRQLLARAVVLAFAVIAGAAIVAFSWLSDRALHAFELIRMWSPWAPFLWTPALCAFLAWLTVRFFPGASGSGIPQVMAALNSSVRPEERHRLVSLKLALVKMGMTACGLMGGLAIGKEGPSVQIAAGIMQHARRWLPRGASIHARGLLVAGGAAGVAATFNAPLAGVMFAIEELTSSIEHRSSGLVVSAIVLAGLVSVSVFGNETYFGIIRLPAPHTEFLLQALVVAVVCGVLGGGFSRLLHGSTVDRLGAMSAWRKKHPVWFAAGCGLVIAILGWASGGMAFGTGYAPTRQLLEGHENTSLLYVPFRMASTWLATWSGVPGGLFAPSLAIGAGVGKDVASLLHMQAQAPALIALGMAAFLAAVTQAPITAFIIVMEMVDGHAMVLSLMTAALGASLVARWIARPLYHALCAAQLARLAAAKAPKVAEDALAPHAAA